MKVIKFRSIGILNHWEIKEYGIPTKRTTPIHNEAPEKTRVHETCETAPMMVE